MRALVLLALALASVTGSVRAQEGAEDGSGLAPAPAREGNPNTERAQDRPAEPAGRDAAPPHRQNREERGQSTGSEPLGQGTGSEPLGPATTRPAPAPPAPNALSPSTPSAAAPSIEAVPPPPPSYGGPAPQLATPRLPVPAMDPAVAAELARLEAERRQLRLGGRVALLAGGFGGAGAAALLAVNFAVEEYISSGCTRCGRNPGTIVFGALGVVAFGLGVTGLILLIRRLRERRDLSRRMRELRSRAGPQPVALLQW